MELDIIRSIQGWHSPALDQCMLWITNLGSEDFYLLIGPIIFWCLGPAVGMRLMVLLLSSFYVNDWLKQLAGTVRPGAAYPQEVRVPSGAGETARAEDGLWNGSFPSGHAQGGLTFWGFMALWLRRWIVTLIAVVMVLLVGLSRVYLGVHWPSDIIGGWLIGAALLGTAYLLTPRIVRLQPDVRERLLLGTAVLALVLVLLDQSPDRAKMLGFWSGAAAGYVVQQRYVTFAVAVPLRLQLAKIGLGLVGLFVLRLLLKSVLPLDPWASWLRYALLGVWVVAIAPLIFRQLLGSSRSLSAHAVAE